MFKLRWFVTTLKCISVLSYQLDYFVTVIHVHVFEESGAFNEFMFAVTFFNVAITVYLGILKSILVWDLYEGIEETRVGKQLHLFFGEKEACFFEFAYRLIENYHFFATNFVLQTPVIVSSLSLNSIILKMLYVNIDFSKSKGWIEYTSFYTNMHHISTM